jgi:hypothetical protein
MSVVQLFYPRPGQEHLAETLGYLKGTGRALSAVLVDGVISILSPREEDAILGIGRDEKTGRFHAVDRRGAVVTEGPTLGHVLQALANL